MAPKKSASIPLRLLFHSSGIIFERVNFGRDLRSPVFSVAANMFHHGLPMHRLGAALVCVGLSVGRRCVWHWHLDQNQSMICRDHRICNQDNSYGNGFLFWAHFWGHLTQPFLGLFLCRFWVYAWDYLGVCLGGSFGAAVIKSMAM